MISKSRSIKVVFIRSPRLSLSGLLSPMKRDLLLRLQSEIENVTDAWLSTALKSLLLIQSRSEQSTVIIFSFNNVCHVFTIVFIFFQLKMALSMQR